MTRQSFFQISGLSLLIVLILLGCNSLPVSITQSTPNVSITPPREERPSIQTTPTLIHPPTIEPTFTRGVNTPVPQSKTPPTPTSLPILETTEEALAFIKHMQLTNGNCELPCWWGITPGKTTAQGAALILQPLKNFPGLRSDYGFHLDEYSNIDVGMYAKGPAKPIEFMQISGFVPFEKTSEHFDTSWQRFFVPNLFAQLFRLTKVA